MPDRADGASPPAIHFSTERVAGSVQHYYHFLLGLLVPLVNFIIDDEDFRKRVGLYLRSSGPLDRIVTELDLEDIHILPPERHQEMQGQRLLPLRLVNLKGLDTEDRFDPVIFRRVSRFVRDRLQPEVLRTVQSLPPRDPRVLLIRRDEPEQFYSTAAAEIKTAGAQRRSISNHAEIRRAVERVVGPCLEVDFERATLAEQIALLSWAKVIVAQHGAALANLIWSNPPAHVIEIVPRPMQPRVERLQTFGRLAAGLGLTHEIVWQDDLHGPVDAELLSLRIATSLPNRST